MIKVKNINDDITVKTADPSLDVRLLILKDTFSKPLKCGMCGGVNGKSCDFCGEITDYEDEI